MELLGGTKGACVKAPSPGGWFKPLNFEYLYLCFVFLLGDLLMPRATCVVCGDRVLFRDSRGFFPGAVTSVCEDTVVITLDPDEE